MRSVSTPMTAAVLAALIAIPTAVVGAEGADPDRTANGFFTGVIRLGAASDDGAYIPVDGGYDVQGTRFDLPLESTDPRMTGLLSFHSNAVGRWNPEGGPAGGGSIESRTYRLTNDGGSWSGTGTSVRADAVDDHAGPTDLGTVLLVGDGAYEGLIAYLSMELDWDLNVFESQVRGLILAADPPPVPEPIEPSVE